MSLTQTAREESRPTGEVSSLDSGARTRPTVVLAGASLCIAAALLLGFVINLAVLGSLTQHRDQKVAFDALRVQLAKGTAAVSPKGVDGRLLPLGTPMAILSIPSLGVKQVVFEGTTSRVLTHGPGHQRSSVLPGQAGSSVVMARRAAFGGPFAGLPNIRKGARIQTTTGQGAATYTVVNVLEGARAATGTADLPENRLTLITAGGLPFVASGVVRVEAVLQGTPQPAPPAAIADSALPAAEAALAGDSSAWVGLVFWLQALILASVGVIWLWLRWGRRQAWVIAVPVVLLLAMCAMNQAALLLPNVL